MKCCTSSNFSFRALINKLRYIKFEASKHDQLSIHWGKHEARSRADHVTEPLDPESDLIVDLPSSTSFKKSYLFHSLNLGACSLHLIEWDRTHTVERWIDTDQWSTHRSGDDKTICEERALIDDLFFWISSIIFIRDEIRDHLSRFSLYLTQIFIFLSVYPRCSAARERIWSAGDLFFWTSSNQIRAAPQSEQSSIPASHQTLAKSLRNQPAYLASR